MFMQDVEQKKWWYRCEICGDETEKRDIGESPSGLEGWHLYKKYPGNDTHICPVCQASGKAPE
jgi:hypothetical protein